MSVVPPPTFSVVTRGEPTLTTLLGDVLDELGVQPLGSGASGTPDLVLVHVDIAEGAKRSERQLRDYAEKSATIAILPFLDDALIAAADRAGVIGWYALGTPLEALVGAVLHALAERKRTGFPR